MGICGAVGNERQSQGCTLTPATCQKLGSFFGSGTVSLLSVALGRLPSLSVKKTQPINKRDVYRHRGYVFFFLYGRFSPINPIGIKWVTKCSDSDVSPVLSAGNTRAGVPEDKWLIDRLLSLIDHNQSKHALPAKLAHMYSTYFQVLINLSLALTEHNRFFLFHSPHLPIKLCR